ncbi:Fibroblast growth factor 6 [Labeo rohita]|uniref:Fibroblast growth factor n=1 Tax=Labeo rohita TaxID=84645 RepID=A0ABQ8MRU1_LABRO|nr:Fibroblast growth factor 6 [Labeo rohita]
MAIAQRLLISMSCEAKAQHWPRTAVLLLGLLLVGIVSSSPLPSRTNRTTLLEKRWESLFSRSVLGISGERPEANWENDYLLGIKRVRRLYCNVGIGFHLQVLPDGKINGVHNENQYSLIEISTVARGVVSLFGVKSELFVAMNNRGRLYGTVGVRNRVAFHSACKCNEALHPPASSASVRVCVCVKQATFKDECKFKETLLPNNYNAYESSVYKGFYVALSKHGRLKRGNKATTAMTVTHFLPRI